MSEELKPLVKRIVEAGYQLSEDGLEYLKTIESSQLGDLVESVIRRSDFSSRGRLVFDSNLLRSISEEKSTRDEAAQTLTGKHRGRPLASEYDAEIKLLNDEKGESRGNIQGFVEYFRSRYRKIESLLRERMDVKDAVTIGQALKTPLKYKSKVIGIVTRKTLRGERLFIELEDQEDSMTLMASDDEALKKGQTLLDDQIVCASVTKFSQDLFIVNDLIWPDVPSKTPRRSETPLCAAFLADVHVGSKLFMGDAFDRFIRWMNMEVGPPDSRNLAGRVKYVVIDGDLVDGIGIYPEQQRELEILDIYKQYEMAAGLLSKLPDYVEIIVTPGNHDAIRKSLPQPPISREYAEPLYQDDRVHMFGNPCRLLLNGVEALVYHGKSLDDVLSRTPGLEFQQPMRGMELLLRCRHLAPIYGASTPLAPEREDRMVIPSTPEILQMGHIHVYDAKRYKGVTLISSSPWQEQTSYQKRMSLIPTPGIAPIFDLQTHQLFKLEISKMQG